MSHRVVSVSREPLKTTLIASLTMWTLSMTGLLAAGRVSLPDATFFVVAPWAVLGAVFRPDWLVLAVVALPANLTAVIQTSRLLALITLALLAVMITRPTFSLTFGTGLLALIGIVVAGYAYQADVGAEARDFNQSVMMLLTYYVLLAVLAFNLALLGELDGRRLGTAFVVGVATTLVLGLAGYENVWFNGGAQIVTRGYLGYLAAGGLGVSLARLLTTDEREHRGFADVLVAGGLLYLTIASFSRAVWIAAVMTFVLLAFQSGRRRYVLIVPFVIALSLGVPSVREELASSAGGNISTAFRTGEITSGRWTLWTELWQRAEPALPWGNGFGFTWSLSSEELFGTEGVFGEDIIPPHNDFMFLLVEFGIPGVLLLCLFWLQLLRAYFRAARSPDPILSLDARVLLGVLMMGFVMSLVANLLVLRPFTEKFFLVAGTILALERIEQTRRASSELADRHALTSA